jgi:hypothetical protein
MSQEHVVAAPDLRQAEAMCRVRANASTSDGVVERRGHDEHRLPPNLPNRKQTSDETSGRPSDVPAQGQAQIDEETRPDVP